MIHPLPLLCPRCRLSPLRVPSCDEPKCPCIERCEPAREPARAIERAVAILSHHRED